ncbi:hypothetical protein T07_5068 [Trichinella nelsoni]|uniref:Uncharacterized protein n=1 Tax=Trichinella nelsoni TaxID=6336 RepID=A0A0V0S4B3_9BILA|nr:hypothetical protein T07_5068 [Trichinella nelsoni]
MFTHSKLRRNFVYDNELPLIFINACVITICLNLFKNAPAVAIIFSPCSDSVKNESHIISRQDLDDRSVELPVFTFIFSLTSFQLQKQQQHKR